MLTSLFSFLPVLLRRSGDSEEAREQAVFAAWAGVVGRPVLRATWPVRLRRKTLTVAVMDATWCRQLDAIRPQVLFKINSVLGSALVTSIQFVIDPRKVANALPTPPEIVFVAPERQIAPFAATVAHIPDQDLRETFLRAAGKCLDRRAR